MFGAFFVRRGYRASGRDTPAAARYRPLGNTRAFFYFR